MKKNKMFLFFFLPSSSSLRGWSILNKNLAATTTTLDGRMHFPSRTAPTYNIIKDLKKVTFEWTGARDGQVMNKKNKKNMKERDRLNAFQYTINFNCLIRRWLNYAANNNVYLQAT
jgi:hypothetical protein